MKKAEFINPLSGTSKPFSVQTVLGYIIGFIMMFVTMSFAQKVSNKVENLTGGKVDASPNNPFNEPVKVSTGVKTTVI
jgi:predicted secreted protein